MHLASQRARAHLDADFGQRLTNSLIGVALGAKPEDLRGIGGSLAVGTSGLTFGLKLHGRASGGDVPNLDWGRACPSDDFGRRTIDLASALVRVRARSSRLAAGFWVACVGFGSPWRRLCAAYAPPCVRSSRRPGPRIDDSKLGIIGLGTSIRANTECVGECSDRRPAADLRNASLAPPLFPFVGS